VRVDGLGVPSTPTWNGSSSTAPETPAGVAGTAIANAAVSATTSGHPGPSIRPHYPPHPDRDRRLPPNNGTDFMLLASTGNVEYRGR